jgi:hypothetical protein
MSHSKEINETSIRQLQITHVKLRLYSDACFEPTLRLHVTMLPSSPVTTYGTGRAKLRPSPATQLIVRPLERET